MTETKSLTEDLRQLAFAAPFGYCTWDRLTLDAQARLSTVLATLSDSRGTISHRQSADEDHLIWDWSTALQEGERFEVMPVEEWYRGIQFPGTLREDGAVTTRVFLATTRENLFHFEEVPVRECLFTGCLTHPRHKLSASEPWQWDTFFQQCTWCQQHKMEEGA